jgi:anti-anti-sigma regulatory factor
MNSANQDIFTAPPRITAANREQFRKASLAFVDDAARRGVPIVTFDLQATEELDASGLGLLVNMQKRAEELGITLEMVRMPKHIRHLLVLTRLEHLFVIVEE